MMRREPPRTEELLHDLGEVLDGRLLACAESCTAGRVAARCAAAPGASSWFRGGLVAYHPEVKRELLGVTAESVFSSQAVREMAVGVATLLGASVAVSTSGVAGDEPVDGCAPGTVYFGTVVDGDVRATVLRFDGDADAVAEQAADAALLLLRAHVRALVPTTSG